MATVDSNCNVITVAPAGRRCRESGLPILIVRLADAPDKGYLALQEEGGDFGDEDCPSSYGRPCLSWFGPGERYPDVFAALDDIAG